MNKNSMFFIFVLGLAAANLGTVRRTEDPIRDTQTNPILYEQKKAEEKDGKKGPLMYHVKNSPYETFFIDPPYEAAKKIPAGEVLTEKVPGTTDITGWWEEQSTAPQEVPPPETVSEPPAEPLPEEKKVQDLESAEQPAPAAEAENASASKENDYWW